MDNFRRKVALLGGIGAAALAASIKPAEADTAFTSFAFAGTGTSTSRTMPDRIADIKNVKEYNAKGDGVTDDTTAIRNALTALWSSNGILYFPPGTYLVSASIDFSSGAGQNRICGAGLGATLIVGTVNNGFIFSSPNETSSGVQEISDLSITNSSTVLGTGAVRWLSNQTGSIFRNVKFTGQVGFDAAFNSFNVSLINCQFSPTTAATPGTVGIISNGVNLVGVRPSVGWDVFFVGCGSNGHFLGGNSIEQCANAALLGVYQGWASSCSISGTTLTVSGTISPSIGGGSAQTSFDVGDYVFGTGVTTDANGFVWGSPLSGPKIAGLGTGTGGAGTYTLDRNCGTVGPVPMFTRRGYQLSCFEMCGFETEGCKNAIYVNNLALSRIASCWLSGVVGEAIKESGGGAKGDTATRHMYVTTASNCKFEGIRGDQGTSQSGIYVDPTGATVNVNFDNCNAFSTANAVTAATSTISGTTLTVLGMVSGTIGVGMTITGTGVTGGTTIVSQLTSTEAGGALGGKGTYQVSASQIVAATTITALGGTAWTVPTTSSSAAGVKFNNCDNPFLGITFTQLPGQAGANTNLTLREGLIYDITDGAVTAVGSNVTAGGASGRYLVRYNGTNWVRIA